MLAQMRAPDGRLQHAWRLGRVTAAGLLDDQAAMARAALALFEATGEPRGSTRRVPWSPPRNNSSPMWTAASSRRRTMPWTCRSVLPRGRAASPTMPRRRRTALMAEVFARLFHLTGDQRWAERARRLIGAFSGLGDGLAMATTLLAAADLLEEGTLVVVAGNPALPATAELLQAALAAPDPAVCVLRASAGALPEGHPAHGKGAPPGGAAAFICRGGVCALPVSDPALLAASLRARARATE